MFSSVGWGEVFVIIVVGLIVIGPERLPKVIQDLRATIIAARTAINNAKQGLNEEFGSDFDEFRKPVAEIAAFTRMGPRAALTKSLLDGDDSIFDAFDPKKIMAEDTAGETERARAALKGTDPQTQTTPETTKVQRPDEGNKPAGGGFSWADIT